uniref:Small ribosomal subunit protein mS40 n=1 Tax=Schistocephalus solidus TaxID=70667 RepID=A0A0X3Q1Q1_SCHSO
MILGLKKATQSLSCRFSILKVFSHTILSKACGIEPTAVAYRAAFKREVPLDDLPFRVNFRGKPYKPATVQESLEYVKSAEFTKLYRGKPVWFYHRRNFKGHFPPKRPRKSCTHGGLLITSNPCPICRDEYLVLDYQNVYLLKHFLHPQSAEILEPTTTGLCQKQHKVLFLEIEKARDLGTIEMRLPFRLFDYADYYGDLLTEEELAQLESHVASGTDSGRRLEPRGSIYRAAAEAVTSLPPSLAGLIRHSALIPHVEEVATEPPATEIESPRLPNRYKMEEAYRKLLLRRRRSKSILLEGN